MSFNISEFVTIAPQAVVSSAEPSASSSASISSTTSTANTSVDGLNGFAIGQQISTIEDQVPSILDENETRSRSHSSSSTGSSSNELPRSLVCNRCRHMKSVEEFMSMGRLLKRCARCRELSSQLKKEKVITYDLLPAPFLKR